jgi:putative transposase
MSRIGKCCDHAPVESLFKSFAFLEFRRRYYDSHEQASRAVRDYIEKSYNPIRLRSAIGFVSPVQFEQRSLCELK